MNKKIVITGIGVVSAIGCGKEATLQALRQGVTGIGDVRYLATAHHEFPVGEVKMSNDEMRRLLGIAAETVVSRTQLMGIIALREALQEAAIVDGDGSTGIHDAAFLSGTTVGGMDLTEAHYPDRLSSKIWSSHDCGASTNAIADYFDCFDYTATPSTACSSALNAIIMGKRLIESGLKDIVVAGGSECLTRFHLNGFKSLMILDSQPCRPFDLERAGLNLGEGAAYLVLESETSALRRGATIIGELKGTGNACDAFHQTASSDDGEGAFLAMTQALAEAGLQPADVQYVNAHGTGTPNNDASESAAIRRVFGDHLPAVSSTKSYTGHTTSASGSIEAAFCLLALRHQFIPQILGFHTPDPQCIDVQSSMNNEPLGPKGRFHSEAEKECPMNHVLCNAFGFGGNDSSIVLSRYEPTLHTSHSSLITPHLSLPTPRVYVTAVVSDVPEEEYRQWLNPMKARRYGKLLKRALVTALKCMAESGIAQPDAIINGTAMGCLENSVRLLDGMVAEGEDVSMPTNFMQSTHNTIASLIGIHTGNHGYNSTYSHGRISFECALHDAFVQLKSGRIKTALVCANDEIPDSLVENIDSEALSSSAAQDCAVAWMLTTEKSDKVLFELTDIVLTHRKGAPDEAEVISALRASEE